MIDYRGQLLTPQQIFAKAETEAGRREIAEYIWRARTAMAAQRVMELLGVVPPVETQQEVCQTIYDTLFRVNIFEIMDYCKSVAEGLEISHVDCAGSA